MEQWLPIEDFPGYEVSDQGRVRNEDTGHILGQYDNGGGILQVVMRRDGRPTARAVHKLVAITFLYPGPPNTVPIHLDGDNRNNTPDNLEWKPLWFARKRTEQLRRDRPLDSRPVILLRTGEVYENALEAAKALNLLEEHILMSCRQGHSFLTRLGHFEFFRPSMW